MNHCILCAKKIEASDSGICPHCGAKSIDRALAWFLKKFIRKEALEAGFKILEVGPSPAQLSQIARSEFIGNARYTAVDLRPLPQRELLQKPHRFLEMDVTRLAFSDQSFDVIICNHVFAFIRSDYQAMAQLHRALPISGVAILNSKVVLPKSKRDSDMTKEEKLEVRSPEDRAEFGDEWVYGEDYYERLEAAGFFYHRYKIGSGLEKLQSVGIDQEEEFVLCFKYRDTMEEFLRRL